MEKSDKWESNVDVKWVQRPKMQKTPTIILFYFKKVPKFWRRTNVVVVASEMLMEKIRLRTEPCRSEERKRFVLGLFQSWDRRPNGFVAVVVGWMLISETPTTNQNHKPVAKTIRILWDKQECGWCIDFYLFIKGNERRNVIYWGR